MNVPLLRLEKGDAIVINGEWYEEAERDVKTVTLRPLAGLASRTFTAEELLDLYFDRSRPMRIVRQFPKLRDPRVADAIKTPFNFFTTEQQRDMLMRLVYVRACDRFFARKIFTKRPEGGYAKIAKVVARYRRLVQASNDGVRSCQVPLEIYCGSAVRDWYMRWRNAGRMIGALAPLTQLKGNRGPNLDPAVIAIISDCVRETWLTMERPPVTVLHQQILGEVKKLNDAGTKAADPSEMAVRRWIRENVDPYTEMLYRRGKKEADHQFRLTQIAPVALRPLQIVEFDETPLDVILVDENGRPRGRANLTVGICIATGMIVGWHIGYEKPSWSTVMQALRMAVLPKNTAGSDSTSAYPVYGVPEIVKCDNGPAYRSTSLVAAAGQLQFELRFVPAGKPHLKGKVERFFLEVTRDFLSVMPGRTFSNVQMRGDYDSSGCARMTLQDINKLFMRWVVDIYHNRPNSRAFGQTPLDRWEALSGCGVRLPPEVEDLTALIGLIVNRTIVAEGITFQGLQYKAAILKLLKQSGHMGRQWMVKVDPNDLQNVLVLDDVKGKWHPIPCARPELINGLSLKMWMDVVAAAKGRTASKQRVSYQTLLEARADLIREAHARNQNAKANLTVEQHRWVGAHIEDIDYQIEIIGGEQPEHSREDGRVPPKRGRKKAAARPDMTDPASKADGHPLADKEVPADPYANAEKESKDDLADELDAEKLKQAREGLQTEALAAAAATAAINENAAVGSTVEQPRAAMENPAEIELPAHEAPPTAPGVTGLIDEDSLDLWGGTTERE